MTSKHYLTQEKYDEFKKELELLRSTKRAEIAEKLEHAKKLGDLSENAEYHDARDDQARLEDRINYIESILNNSSIVKSGLDKNSVNIGSTVKIKRLSDSSEFTFKIVGSEESDTSSGKLSNVSPLGSALVGSKVGDTRSFNAPKGVQQYQILEIS